MKSLHAKNSHTKNNIKMLETRANVNKSLSPFNNAQKFNSKYTSKGIKRK